MLSFSRSNMSKLLNRIAPREPQGGLDMARMARSPRTAMNYPTPQNPMMAVPHPIVDTPENIQRMPRSRGFADVGSMLAKFAEQFRNAETVPNTRPGMFGGMQPRPVTPEEAAAITSMPATGTRTAEPPSYMPPPTPRVNYAPGSATDIVVQPRPVMPPVQPMPDIVVQPRPTMPEPAVPSFDPNRALNDYNNRLAGIYAGGGNMDMNMIRAQQANLRNLQLDRNATAEQHDAAYRAALSELRSRYPDAFAA